MHSNRERQQISIPDSSILTIWRKSSYSGASSGECLEVGSAHRQAGIPVRDSKNPHGPAVLFGAPAWTAFISSL